ncbi:NACHT domain-containing protein [Laspinema palackyanum]|uniref:NACHT domain-containing protein n=1 Tax=Laspinema palackyanum TaxID=3231601 RepID=UPI00345CD35E|nr:NACHT domain-containing protein [Laspinema sp. D2c]
MKKQQKRSLLALGSVVISLSVIGVSLAQTPKLPETTPTVESTPTATPEKSPKSERSPSPEPSPAALPTGSPASPSPETSPAASPRATSSAGKPLSIDWNVVGAVATVVGAVATVAAIIFSGVTVFMTPKFNYFWQDRRSRKQEKEADAKRLQAEVDGEKAYLDKLRVEVKNPSICNLPRVPNLDLESIYVELQVREEKQHYVKPEEIEQQAVGDPNELLQQVSENWAHPRKDEWAPEAALANFPRMVVLGDPGAGKTTMEHYLTLKMAKQESPILPYLPFYVELGKFIERKNTKESKDTANYSLLDFIADELDNRYGFCNARPYLDRLLSENKAAFLLDGLDETSGGETRQKADDAYNHVVHAIDDLSTLCDRAPIVITCRKAGWRGGLKGFKSLEVLDFNWEQIQKFIKNWFASDPNKAEGLRQKLTENLRMQTLAGNPLILSLIAIVYQNDLELPERRTELYKRCLEVLLQEWDSSRGIKRFSQFTTDRKRDLLQEVAWSFHLCGKRYFPEDELLEVIANFLPTIAISTEEKRVILNEIAAQYGLLKEQAQGWYGFLHLTFQEYFTARAANDKGLQGIQQVVAHHHESWWQEVIFLLAGLLNDATPLLLGILGYSTEQLSKEVSPAIINDDLFHSNLLLAARCLIGTPRISKPGLRESIISEVKNLFLTSPYAFDCERSVGVLVEIGGDLVNSELRKMLKNKQIDSGKRSYIAFMFGKVGIKNVMGDLLEIVQDKNSFGRDVYFNSLLALADLDPSTAFPLLQNIIFSKKVDILLVDQLLPVIDNLVEKVTILNPDSVFFNFMELLEKPRLFPSFSSVASIASIVAKLGDDSIGEKLLQLLLSPNTDLPTKLDITQTLKALKDKSIINFILLKLKDETLGWQTRWLLTEVLEEIPDNATEPLQKIVTDQTIDVKVRVGIAATLGALGLRDTIQFLCEAIETQSVPADLKIGRHTQLSYCWQRITYILKSLEDYQVKAILEKAFDEYISSIKSRSSPQNKFDFDFKQVRSIIKSAEVYKSEQMARQMIKLLDESMPVFQDNILNCLPKFTSKSIVPDLLILLENREKYHAQEWRWDAIVYAIGNVADDEATVRALVNLMKTTPKIQKNPMSFQEKPGFIAALYEALYSVSQRAKVKINPDLTIDRYNTL